jgi:hypothetical protein
MYRRLRVILVATLISFRCRIESTQITISETFHIEKEEKISKENTLIHKLDKNSKYAVC